MRCGGRIWYVILRGAFAPHKRTIQGDQRLIGGIVVLDERYVHPRLSSSIRAPSVWRRGYCFAGGRDTERSGGGEEQGEVRYQQSARFTFYNEAMGGNMVNDASVGSAPEHGLHKARR
jgi:hypothetical protein